MTANRNLFYLVMTLTIGAFLSTVQWGLPVYAATDSFASRASSDARLIGDQMQRQMLADGFIRPSRLTCLNERCSKILELPDLTLANGNRVRMENVDTTGRIVAGQMTERYRIVVTPSSGLTSAVYDTHPGDPIVGVDAPEPQEEGSEPEKSYGLVDDLLTALHEAVTS